jgi:hypothetical protein
VIKFLAFIQACYFKTIQRLCKLLNAGVAGAYGKKAHLGGLLRNI